MSPIGICTTFLLISAASAALTVETAKPLVKLGFRKISSCECRGTVVRGGGIAIVVAFILCGYLCNGFWKEGILQLLNGIMPALIVLLMAGLLATRRGSQFAWRKHCKYQRSLFSGLAISDQSTAGLASVIIFQSRRYRLMGNRTSECFQID